MIRWFYATASQSYHDMDGILLRALCNEALISFGENITKSRYYCSWEPYGPTETLQIQVHIIKV